jgi:hypothetical protein
MMMKKTLAFGMLLSMASFAIAGLQIEVSGGKAMVTGQLDVNQFVILSAGDGATLSNFTLGAQAPAASYMAAMSDDFALVGVPIPNGYKGEGWFLGTFPGETYKTGTQLQADLAVTTTQETRTWEEFVTGPCPYGWPIIRTWTEITEIQKGSLSLASLSADYSQGSLIQNLSLDKRNVIGLTFIDSPCPEPATLALFGLGLAIIRRKHSA